MNKKRISAKLWHFSKKISEKANEYKNKRKIIKRRKLYIKAKVTNFDYKEGNIKLERSIDRIQKKEWDWFQLFDFIETVIRQSKEYQNIVSEISKERKMPQMEADCWLFKFAQKLTYRILENATDKILEDHITAFVSDLEKAAVEWKTKIWIQGIWLEDKDYDIYSGLKIRKTRPSDLEEETIFGGTFQFPFGITRIPTAILELTFKAKEQGEIWDEIEMILNCFRLFRLGSVFSEREDMEPKSILRVGGTITKWPIFTAIYKYRINKKDIPKLRDLLKKVRNLLPKKYLQGILPKRDAVFFSLQRYNEAVLKQGSVESRITSTITCLEALYLKREESMELSHRLSQRTSGLLRLFNFAPLEVYSTVKRAYKIRSGFIHGSQSKPAEHKNNVRLLESVLNYARVSILVFLQVKSLIGKDELVDQIDNSLLDGNACSKLERFIRENCKFWPFRW